MWKRFRNVLNKENTLRSASITLVLTMAASNVLGLIRDHYLARNIATSELDIYYAAFRIPDLIFNILILGAISAAFIPVFTSHLAKGEKEEAFKITNSLITVSATVLLFLAILLYFLMPWLTPFLVPSFDADRLNKTTELARILMLTPVFFSASYFIGGVLNSFKRFLAYAFAPLIYNLAIIAGAVFVAPHYGVVGVTWCVVLGSLLHLLVQVPTAISLGYKFRISFSLAHRSIKRVFKLMIPRAVGMGASNIMLFAFTAISSALAAGSIAVFNLANNIQTVPTVVFATSFSTAIFPTLAEKFSTGDHQSYTRYLNRSIRVIVYLLVPSTVLFIILRAQIIRLILGSGKFDWTDTKMAALTLGWFSFSLVAQGLIPLLAKAFYARHDTKTPTYISVASIVISILFAYPLSRTMGVAGLALAFSVGSYFNAIVLYCYLQKRAKVKLTVDVYISAIKVFFGGLIMAFAVRYMALFMAGQVDMTRFVGVLIQACVAGAVGLVVYVLFTSIFGSEELSWAITRKVANGEKKS